MIGYSGTYAINNTLLALQPTEGHWLDPEGYGYDGYGHPITSAYRSFELVWQLISSDDLKQLIDFVRAVSSTGTASVDLPEWGGNGYIFTTYSGTTLSPVQAGIYYMGYVQDVRLSIFKIAV